MWQWKYKQNFVNEIQLKELRGKKAFQVHRLFSILLSSLTAPYSHKQASSFMKHTSSDFITLTLEYKCTYRALEL